MCPLATALGSSIEFAKVLIFASRLFYLTALCTIWELPSVLAERYESIRKGIRNLRRTGN
jgi:hypothetical protein